MQPNQVEPTAREMMAALKKDWDHKGPTVTSGGTNTVTLTYSVATAAYARGQLFSFIVGGSNTGAATLNVDALGAKNIFANGAALIGGELQAGRIVLVAYDGTQFDLIATDGTRGVAQGGTGDSGSAWTAYTPTVTAQSGTFTSVTGTGRYKTIGKTTFVQIAVGITTNGTAGSWVIASLPNTAGSAVQILAGRATVLSTKMLQGQINGGGTTVAILNYDNSYPGATGEQLVLSGVYESA